MYILLYTYICKHTYMHTKVEKLKNTDIITCMNEHINEKSMHALIKQLFYEYVMIPYI